MESGIFFLALVVLGFALVSARAARGVVTAPMIFAGAGLALAALPFGEELAPSGGGLQLLAEVTLALTLFTDAARIDLARLRREHVEPLRLLLVAMPLSMALGAALGLALFPGLGLLPALVLGVVLAPTDAALGQAVVTNRSVPARVRQTLNVESGLNDGLAFPVLVIAATLALSEEGRGAAGWAWFVASQVGLGPLAGLAAGMAGARLVRGARARGSIAGSWLRIAGLAVALAGYTGAELIGGNGFISAFCAGIAFGASARDVLREVEEFGETEGDLLSLVVFFVFGALLLPETIGTIGWRHLLYAALSLTAIRMVPVALVLLGLGLRPATLAFLGWFGPRGLASIIYLLLLQEEYQIDGLGTIAPAVVATVTISIVLHGASAAPLARAYAARMARLGPEGAAREHRAAPAHPVGRHARFERAKPEPPRRRA